MKQLISIVILVMFISCNSEKDYGKFLNKRLMQIDQSILAKFDTIVIIPRKGCNACIDQADKFFRENLRENILFVFTSIDSRKHLELELGKENVKKNNVLLDLDNIMYSFTYEDSGYPLILIKKNSKAFEYVKLNPLF